MGMGPLSLLSGEGAQLAGPSSSASGEATQNSAFTVNSGGGIGTRDLMIYAGIALVVLWVVRRK